MLLCLETKKNSIKTSFYVLMTISVLDTIAVLLEEKKNGNKNKIETRTGIWIGMKTKIKIWLGTRIRIELKIKLGTRTEIGIRKWLYEQK